jgi:hypothetical protein
MKHSEESEQKTLFQWASYHPELRWLHAIPNGGNRSPREARRLKLGGVKSGVSDIFLPRPMGDYHGLYIEMKRRKVDGRSVVSRAQVDFHIAMMGEGYACAVCYGCDEAIKEIKEYLMW